VVRLAVHALSERAVSASLSIAAELVHVVGVVRATIIRVVVWVACRVPLLATMLLLHVLALRARSTALLSWVRCVVPAVLGVVVSALALLMIVRKLSTYLLRHPLCCQPLLTKTT
jgi:hypothetical protein